MATANRMRALNRLPYDFEDGLKIAGVDVTTLNQIGTANGAGLVGFAPVGNISAGNVQAAIAELDTEKVGFARLDDTDGSSLVGYDGGTVQDVLDAVTGPNGAASVGYMPAGSSAVATTVQEVMRRSVNIVDFMTPEDRTSNFSAPGSVDVTYASNLAITHLLTLGGGEVEMPSGVFKLNLVIPEGVVFSGKSSANILTNDPKGTKLIAANSALPVVKINGSTFISGAGLRGVCIDAAGAQTGLYIAGCAYINIDKVSVINAAHTNILIECLANLPTYFIFLNSVTTYNAASYNFRVLENLALGGTFTTSIFCSNFISYTLPGKTTAGRIAYIQAQVIASGYWEDRGDDIIVIDRGSATTPGGLTGKGLVIDGETGKNSIKIIPVPGVASYQRINTYICGNVSIDGNTYNSVTGDSVIGPVGNIEADYTISGLRKATHKHPLIIGSDSGFSYRFYDSTAKALRQKVTAPTSASDGNVISGAEAAFVAAPTTGSWVKGDVVFNANPFRGGVSGWVCIASGTPGTWETFGTVGAVENVASLPTPDSSQRGRMVTVLAGAGTADKIYICLRSAATTYSWVQVAAG